MSATMWAVLKREYLQRVRSKWFIAATLGAPIIFLGLMIIPALMASQGAENERRIEVVDRTGVLFQAAAPGIGEVGYEATLAEAPDPAAIDSLRARVERGDLGGFLILDQETLSRGAITFVAEKQPSSIRSFGLRQVIVQTALAIRMQDDLADVAGLLAGGEFDLEVLGNSQGFEDVTFIQAYLGAFFLYMSLLLFAIQVMRSVLEEKRDKVVEIIVSAMRPADLMLGKILGVGLVGLTQLGIWVISAILIYSSGLPAVMAMNPEANLEMVRAAIPGMGYVGLLLLYFIGGYFMYSGLYAAVGAMCSTDEEAQQAQFPVIMLLVVPIVFVTGVIQDPDSTLSVGLSFFPFFTPILMFARAVAGGAAAWEIAASAVLMAATVVAVAWLAGRIYKVGILMTGKRPTLPELVRWVREA